MGKGKKDQRFIDKAFRFEAKWCLDTSFEGLVEKWWTECSGSILVKLQSLSYQIQCWSKKKKEKSKVCADLEDRLNFLYNQDLFDEILAEIFDLQLGLNLEADKE